MKQFTSIMNTKFVAILLFFSTFFTAKANNIGDNTSSLDSIEVGIDLGFGAPYGWKDTKKDTSSSEKFDVGPNFHTGLTFGYSFEWGESFHVTPEIGLLYSFTRTSKDLSSGFSIKEKYLQVPMVIKFLATDDNSFIMGGGLSLGYELNLVLSSRYQQGGDEEKDSKETAPDLPMTTGNIVLGGIVQFPKGFCLDTKLKFPVTELYRTNKAENNKTAQKGMKTRFASMRGLMTSAAEVSLVVNLIELFK